MARTFDRNNIILVRVDESDFNTFLIDMDIDDDGEPLYLIDDLTKAIINAIPEYVFANYENPEVPQTDMVEKLREAAKCIYKIKDYDLMRRVYIDGDQDAYEKLKQSGNNNRGEFGELLLHLILRDFKGTIPLVSKVYFKDAAGVPAHGFDAVHISPKEEILWLGESKLYKDSKSGIRALLEDLDHHFTRAYLDEQFLIIKKNVENNSIPQRELWLEKLTSANKLKDCLKIINIPILCTYEDDIYNKFSTMDSPEAMSYHEISVRELKKYFDEHYKHPLKEQLNVILILFPVRDKKELVQKLHEKLWHMQNL